MNSRAPRSTLGVGLVLLGAVCTYACQSSPGAGPSGGKGGAGARGGTGGTTGSGGDAGRGGNGAGAIGGGGACTGSGGDGYSEIRMTPCGPTGTCDGNTLTSYQYCDQRACSGPFKVWRQTDCGSAATCGGGRCLTHANAPAKACSVATDCGLPPTVCVGDTEQLIFSDPSCDGGQCHWKQIVDECGTASGTPFYCMAGTCYALPVLTGSPLPPTPSPDPIQPPPASDHACTTAADCPQPPPTCFRDSVVSYVHSTCRTGMCDWDINLDQCAAACNGGACVMP